MPLTKKQQEAVEYCEGPLLIVAGPGTGKTKTLTEKVAYLVLNKNIHPNNILVSTFTIKAAEELRDRLREKIGNKVESMQISTIHSFCEKMLQDFSEFHRFGASFSVLDEDDQYLFIKSKLGYWIKDYVKGYDLIKLMNLYNKPTENNVNAEEFIKHFKENNSNELEQKPVG